MHLQFTEIKQRVVINISTFACVSRISSNKSIKVINMLHRYIHSTFENIIKNCKVTINCSKQKNQVQEH